MEAVVIMTLRALRSDYIKAFEQTQQEWYRTHAQILEKHLRDMGVEVY